MQVTNRKVRVFISSTFDDMHAERDHLFTVMFTDRPPIFPEEGNITMPGEKYVTLTS
jgi:hypothetical protein